MLSTCLFLVWTIPSRACSVDLDRPVHTTSQYQAEGGMSATTSPPGLRAHIDPNLLKQALREDGAFLRFVVEMNPQSSPAGQLPDLPAVELRAWLVDSLQTTATQAQARLLSFLQAEQRAGHVETIHPFWVVNAIAITADAQTLLAIAARPDVHVIRKDRWRRWIDPFTPIESAAIATTNDPQWNISHIRADLAWSALGLDGQDVTVAIFDTGVDWQHPALQAQYRGYKPGGMANHEGNWFCTTDEGALYPVDGNGHGTHVAGTSVGSQDAGGQAIGVAPGAQWIAVKAFNDQGYAYDSWIHAAIEWILAPAGDPGLAPDIVNSSWGSSNGQDEAFRSDLQALQAARIVPIFSAGNDGPSTSSIGSPASLPEALAVGATDGMDVVATFSSRGPSPWGEFKPEVVAPGVQIRSSLPGGTYGLKNGTSMAAPHVSGVVALMLQADPSLSVDEVEAILTSTAHPLGDQVPNNSSGWGRIDGYRAASVALKAGFVSGTITRHPDLQPLPTAQIAILDDLGEPWASVPADETGRYHVALPAGRYDLTATAFGYAAQSVPGITVQSGMTTTFDFTLSPLPGGVLWGQVTDVETAGPVGAELAVLDTPAFTSSDPQTGQYSLALPAGIYSVQISQNGYRSQTIQDVEILANQDTRLDAALTPAPSLLLVDSGPWYYDSRASFFQQALDDGNYVYDLWQIRNLATDVPTVEDLAPYQITIWSSPQDSPGLVGAGDTISDYLSIDGNLLLTGQDVGYWDDGLSSVYWHPYYRLWLKARAVADNAGQKDIVGVADEILGGLVLSINGADSAANQITPDLIAVHDPSDAAIIGQYRDDGGAVLRASGCQSYRVIYLAAGLEGLGDRAGRAEVMDRALSWLDSPHPAVDLRLSPPHQNQVWLDSRTLTYTVELQNTGGSTDRFDLELATPAWPATVWDGNFSQTLTRSMALSPCATQTLGLKVTVPPDVTWNVGDTVTLTARSLSDPNRSAQATFSTKAPAPILLVDDQRWYDNSEQYRAALQASGLPYDLWSTRQAPFSDVAPSPQQLGRYPIIVWFTGYDWYRTLTPEDEARLAAYLDEGGRLLLTSQDYLYTSGFTPFARDYFGVADYTEGLTVAQVAGAVGNVLGEQFDLVDLSYPFRNWSDALRPYQDSQIALWGQHGQPVALTLHQAPWKTAFFAFPLEAMPDADLARLIGGAVGWLSPLGDSSLAVDRATAGAGDELAYALDIRNTGPHPLNSASLSNTLPISASYVAGSLEGPATYDPASRRVEWTGSLSPGQTIAVRYRLQPDAPLPAGSTIRNVVDLQDESGLALQQMAETRIETADLSGSTKVVNKTKATAGEILTYTITLSNNGLGVANAELLDPWPRYTQPMTGSAWASAGQVTATEESLLWRGSIPPGENVTLTFATVPLSTCMWLYAYNRARLDDGWGGTYPLEAYTWVTARVFLPIVFRQQ